MRIVNYTTYNPSLVWKRLTIPFFPDMTMNREYDRLNTLGWKEQSQEKRRYFFHSFLPVGWGDCCHRQQVPHWNRWSFPFTEWGQNWNFSWKPPTDMERREGKRCRCDRQKRLSTVQSSYPNVSLDLPPVCCERCFVSRRLQCPSVRVFEFVVSAVREVFFLWLLADIRLCCWNLSQFIGALHCKSPMGISYLFNSSQVEIRNSRGHLWKGEKTHATDCLSSNRLRVIIQPNTYVIRWITN